MHSPRSAPHAVDGSDAGPPAGSAFGVSEQGGSVGRVDVNGALLEVVDKGEGEPLVLVHGSTSDYRNWENQIEPFSASFRTIAYSRRYHWPNERIPTGKEYLMNEQVDDLRALIHRLDLAPVHLAGHSFGAFLALMAVIREPEIARTLTLAEPPVVTLLVSSTPKPGELLKLFLTRPRTAAAIVKFGAKGVEPAAKAFAHGDDQKALAIFAEAIFGPGGYDDFTRTRKRQIQDNVSETRAELLGPGFLPLEAAQVQRVETPTLLLNGKSSIPLFKLLADRLAELLPHVERVSIPGAGHMMQEDNPAAFNAAVLGFLQRESAAQTAKTAAHCS